jgi:hypothetical protein
MENNLRNLSVAFDKVLIALDKDAQLEAPLLKGYVQLAELLVTCDAILIKLMQRTH